MRTRIYRAQRGWTIDRHDPSGGHTRNIYPTGEAALTALDSRNRARRSKPAPDPVTSFWDMIRDALLHPRRQSDYERRA